MGSSLIPGLLTNLMPIYLAILPLSMLPLVPFSQTPEQLREEVDKLIHYEAEIDFKKTPGFIIGIIDGDSTYVLPYGTLYTDTIVVPDEHHVFEIGDLTQVLTATLLYKLAQAGLLDFKKNFNEYLPDSLQNPTAQDLSIIHLLTHTSGLPRLPFGIGLHVPENGQLFTNYPLPSLAEFYRSFDFNVYKKGDYRYSPTGFAVLELFFYQKMSGGEKLDEYYNEWIFRPLGMCSSYFIQDEPVKIAPGYTKAGIHAEPQSYGSFRLALGMKSTLHDLLLFTKACLQADGDFSELFKPKYPTGIRKNTWAAMGWHVIQRRKGPNIVTHTGSTPGQRASIAFVGETRTGVVILSNSPYGLNGLEFDILRMLNKDWKRGKSRK